MQEIKIKAGQNLTVFPQPWVKDYMLVFTALIPAELLLQVKVCENEECKL